MVTGNVLRSTMDFICIPLFVIMGAIPLISSSKILFVPIQVRSHIHEQFTVGEQLVEMGHEVYAALGDRIPMHKEAKDRGIKVVNFHIPPDAIHFTSKDYVNVLHDMVFVNGFDVVSYMETGSKILLDDCIYMLQDDTFTKHVKQLTFDIAIGDALFVAPCSLLIPASLNIPFIALTAVFMPTWAGIPALPSFVPAHFTEYTSNMTFSEKLSNIFAYAMLSNTKIIPYFANLSGITDTTLLQKHDLAYNDLIQLYSKADFYIVTNDHHLESPVPSLPYTLYLPGITVAPARPLVGDIGHIASQATNGIIIVSFGTFILPWPSEVIKKFFDAFKDLPHTVIWKYPDFPTDLKPLAPSNVIIMAWLPQNDLLGHPNTKLFITHCGNNGQYEALYHGVRMIGFPLFAEQHHNAHRMQAKGVGLTMDIMNFDAVTLKANIHDILDNKQIKSKVDKFTKVLKSRPMLPREEAAYWVDHIIKFGSDHLKSSAQEMPMYQLYMVDVALLFGGLILLVGGIMLGLIVFFYKWCLKMVNPSIKFKIN